MTWFYSSATSLPILPALEPSTSTVTGVTDWEFLKPDHSSSAGEQEPAHKISLDDFDGEISVFQVSRHRTRWREKEKRQHLPIFCFFCYMTCTCEANCLSQVSEWVKKKKQIDFKFMDL